MKTFRLDSSYEPINFESISVDDLMVISGGSGSGSGTYPIHPDPLINFMINYVIQQVTNYA